MPTLTPAEWSMFWAAVWDLKMSEEIMIDREGVTYVYYELPDSYPNRWDVSADYKSDTENSLREPPKKQHQAAVFLGVDWHDLEGNFVFTFGEMGEL